MNTKLSKLLVVVVIVVSGGLCSEAFADFGRCFHNRVRIKSVSPVKRAIEGADRGKTPDKLRAGDDGPAAPAAERADPPKPAEKPGAEVDEPVTPAVEKAPPPKPAEKPGAEVDKPAAPAVEKAPPPKPAEKPGAEVDKPAAPAVEKAPPPKPAEKSGAEVDKPAAPAVEKAPPPKPAEKLDAEVHEPVTPAAGGADPSAPVGEPRPEIPSGSRVSLFANFVGREPGVVIFETGGASWECRLLAWKPDSVTVDLPLLGLAEPKNAQITIVLPDGRIAKTFKVLYVSQSDITMHEESIRQPTPPLPARAAPANYVVAVEGGFTLYGGN